MMKRQMHLFFAVALLALAYASNAQLGASICPSLFPSNGIVLRNTNVYTTLISVSLLITLMVLTALGLVYAIGNAFGFEKLKSFTKTEFLESSINVIIIMLIAGGLAFADGGIAFFSNVGLAGLQSVTTVKLSAPTSAQGVYTQICMLYLDQGFNVFLSNWLPTVLTSSVLLGTLQNLKIDITLLNAIEFSFNPFAGVKVLSAILNQQAALFGGAAIMLVAVIFALVIIYFLFPLFLFVGVFLRSFPWTRAAGGTFLALFISFYIVFPALLYPFAAVMAIEQTSASQLNTLSSGLLASTFSNTISSFQSSTSSFFFSTLPTSEAVNPAAILFSAPQEINTYGQAISALGIQMLGILISATISLDLVEAFGDLLGAPSLEHGKHNILGKII